MKALLIKLAVTLLTLYATTSFGQSAKEYVMPGVIYQVAGHGAGWYESPQAGFAAYRAAYPCSYMSCELTNLHSCSPSRQFGFIWGEPVSWCHDYKFTTSGGTVYQGEGGVTVSTTHFCPIGWSIDLDWVGEKATGWYYSTPPYETEYVCSRMLNDVQCPPGDCGGFGNPIFAEDATKRQREIDYAPLSGASALRFERTYRSDQRVFTAAFDAAIEQPGKGMIGRGCLQAVGRLSSGLTISHCFQRLSASDHYLSTRSATGHTQYFAWDGSAATAVRHRVLDEVEKLSTGTGEMWRQRRSKEGDFLIFGASGELVKIVRLDGYVQDLTYSNATTPTSVAPDAGYLIGIADSWGRSLQMTYGTEGELATLTLPGSEQVSYHYDSLPIGSVCHGVSCLRLVGVTYADGAIRTYHWDEPTATTDPALSHLLTGITDETGTRYSTYRYSGANAVSTELAGGVSKYQFSNIALRISVDVKDPNDVVRTFRYVNADGLVRLSSIDGQPCPQCGPKAQSFDWQGKLIGRDDFNDNRTCFAYDTNRNVEVVRIEGLSNYYHCSYYLSPGRTFSAGVRKISTQWHPHWHRPARIAEPGRLTVMVYNGEPDPFAGDAPAVCAPTTAVLPDGNPIAVVCRKVEIATTDVNGTSGFSATHAAGVPQRHWQWTYNAHGQVLTEDGPRTDVADVVQYEYYATTTSNWTRGDLKKKANAQGHSIEFTKYDAHGQLLEATDANGVKTSFTYDLRQRLTSVEVSQGASVRSTTVEYWPTGKLKKVTQPDGSYLSYAYDAAQRLAAMSDSEGNSISYTLDAMGNRIAESVKDPTQTLVHSMQRSFDALNRLQQLTGVQP